MQIQRDRDALLVIDFQRDFMPAGAVLTHDIHSLPERLDRLASLFTEVIVVQDLHPRGHISFATSYAERAPFDSVDLGAFERGELTLSDRAAFTPTELRAYLADAPGGIQLLWPDHCVIGSEGADPVPGEYMSRATMIIRRGVRAAADSSSAFGDDDGRQNGLASALTVKGIERIFVAGLAAEYGAYRTVIDAADVGFDGILVDDVSLPLGLASEPGGSIAARLRNVGSGIVESGDLYA